MIQTHICVANIVWWGSPATSQTATASLDIPNKTLYGNTRKVEKREVSKHKFLLTFFHA